MGEAQNFLTAPRTSDKTSPKYPANILNTFNFRSRQLRTKVSQSMADRKKVKFVKGVRCKYNIGYNSSYANLNPTQPTQNWEKSPPNPTHGWTRPMANSGIDAAFGETTSQGITPVKAVSWLRVGSAISGPNNSTYSKTYSSTCKCWETFAVLEWTRRANSIKGNLKEWMDDIINSN